MQDRHYIFSGSLSTEMGNHIKRLCSEGKMDPMDVLVSQEDRSGVKSMLKWMEEGIVSSLFIDSGAYSAHTQGIDIDVDEYLDFVNGIDDKIIAVAQVDKIPGRFQQPKTPEDYIESVDRTWENFLYMHPRMKSPEKLIYVFHQGESFDTLRKILEWRDENGKPLQYLGISPSNDRNVAEKDIYLQEVYDVIAKSDNPNIRTHLFGYTSLPGLPKFDWYTADSVSHRLRAAYNKVFTRKWGVISFSMTRNAKTKADLPFTEVCDKDTLKDLTAWVEDMGFTVDQLSTSSSVRTVLDIHEVQEYIKENPYIGHTLKRPRKLFQI